MCRVCDLFGGASVKAGSTLLGLTFGTNMPPSVRKRIQQMGTTIGHAVAMALDADGDASPEEIERAKAVLPSLVEGLFIQGAWWAKVQIDDGMEVPVDPPRGFNMKDAEDVLSSIRDADKDEAGDDWNTAEVWDGQTESLDDGSGYITGIALDDITAELGGVDSPAQTIMDALASALNEKLNEEPDDE